MLLAGLFDFKDSFKNYTSVRVIQDLFSPSKSLENFFTERKVARWKFLDQMRVIQYSFVIIMHIILWPFSMQWFPLIGMLVEILDEPILKSSLKTVLDRGHETTTKLERFSLVPAIF